MKQGGLFDVADESQGSAVQDVAAAEARAPSAIPGEVRPAVQAQREGGEQVREDGPEGGEAGDPGSLRWYAEAQKRLWEEGVKSASAYWAKRGVRWP